MATRKAFRLINVIKENPAKSRIVIRPHPNAELRSRRNTHVQGIPAQMNDFMAQVRRTDKTIAHLSSFGGRPRTRWTCKQERLTKLIVGEIVALKENFFSDVHLNQTVSSDLLQIFLKNHPNKKIEDLFKKRSHKLLQ